MWYSHYTCTCTCNAPYLMCVGPYWYPESPAQSKVGQLDGSLLINEQVLWLEVAMQHTSRVAEYNALENLVRVALKHKI